MMKCSVVKRKVAYSLSTDGIDAYHAELFHGSLRNEKVDDNNLGDPLVIPLQLDKNAYDLNHILQPQRNLVLPEGAKQRLSVFPNISFFPVVFKKLFFQPFKKGESIGPERYDEMDDWLASFKHEEGLRQEIEAFYELVVPSYDRLKLEFKHLQRVEFNLESWRTATLDLSVEMLQTYPGIWSAEGIVLRQDVFESIEEFFCWDYFHRTSFTVQG